MSGVHAAVEEEPPAIVPPSRRARKRRELSDYYAEHDERLQRRKSGVWLRSLFGAIGRGELAPFRFAGLVREQGVSPIAEAIAGFVALAWYLRHKPLVCTHQEMANAVTLWFQRARNPRTCSVAAVRFWIYRLRDDLPGWVEGVTHFGERQQGPGHSQLCSSYHPGLFAQGEIRTALKRRATPGAKPLAPVVSAFGRDKKVLFRAPAPALGLSAPIAEDRPSEVQPAGLPCVSAPPQLGAPPTAPATAGEACEGMSAPCPTAGDVSGDGAATRAARAGAPESTPTPSSEPTARQIVREALMQPAPFVSPVAVRSLEIAEVVDQLKTGEVDPAQLCLGAILRWCDS